MAASLKAVVISAQSKMIRRVIIPDHDSEVLDNRHVGPGEMILTFPMSQPHDPISLATLVQQQTGISPPNPRCAVVDRTNTVVAIVNADPLLDKHPLGDLIPHPTALPRDALVNGVLARDNSNVALDHRPNRFQGHIAP